MINSKAALKRDWKDFTFKLIVYGYYDNKNVFHSQKHPMLNMERAIEHVQSNAIRFTGGSWLYLDQKNEFTFEGNRMIVDNNVPYGGRMEYEISRKNSIT